MSQNDSKVGARCRCCLAEYSSNFTFKDMNEEYFILGVKEIYAEMLFECFGLIMPHLDTSKFRLICEPCVIKLRGANNFKAQVCSAQAHFLNELSKQELDIGELKSEIKQEDEEAKECSSHNSVNNDDHDSNDVFGGLLEEPSANQESSPPPPIRKRSHSKSSEDDEPLSTLKVAPPKKQITSKKKINLKHKFADVPAKTVIVATQRGNSKVMVVRNDQGKMTIVSKPVRTANIEKNPAPNQPCSPLVKSLTIARAQQRIRETDNEYMMAHNAITILNNSYVIPFKNKQNSYLCFFCHDNFRDPDELKTHTVTEHKTERLKTFIKSKHMIKIDVTRIDCKLCDESVDQLEDCVEHLQKKHGKKIYSKCAISVLPFKLSRDKMFCVKCNEGFRFFHALNQHMNDHFSNFVCEQCGLGFVEQHRLAMHKYKHAADIYPCEICGRNFKNESYKRLHIDRIHNKKGRDGGPIIVKCNYGKKMQYSDDAMTKAIRFVKNGGAVRQAAQDYGVPRSTIQKRIKQIERNELFWDIGATDESSTI